MGLKNLLARVKCYFTSSCCKDIDVNVNIEKKIETNLAEKAEQTFKDYGLYQLDDSD